MGTWKAPHTLTEVERFEKLMESKIVALGCEDVIAQSIGDDSLFDALYDAKEADVDADVRSIVLATLHEWVNIMPESNWTQPREEVVGERLEAILKRGIAQIEEDDVIYKLSLYGENTAGFAVADILGFGDDEQKMSRLTVRQGSLPSVIVVEDIDDKVYNFDRIWGVVTEVPSELRERYLANMAPETPALAM